MVLKRATAIITSFIFISFIVTVKPSSAAIIEPKSDYNLAKKGIYRGYGEAVGIDLYSNYYFTGVSRMRFHIYNYGDEKFTVNVYKKGNIFCQKRWEVTGHSTSIKLMDTESNSRYYIIFDSPCSFNYSVQTSSYK